MEQRGSRGTLQATKPLPNTLIVPKQAHLTFCTSYYSTDYLSLYKWDIISLSQECKPCQYQMIIWGYLLKADGSYPKSYDLLWSAMIHGSRHFIIPPVFVCTIIRLQQWNRTHLCELLSCNRDQALRSSNQEHRTGKCQIQTLEKRKPSDFNYCCKKITKRTWKVEGTHYKP